MQLYIDRHGTVRLLPRVEARTPRGWIRVTPRSILETFSQARKVATVIT